MADIFERQRKSDNRERAAILKAKVGCEDAISALGLDSDLGDVCPNAQCETVGALSYSEDSQTFRCSACGECGYAITMARMAKGLTFNAALNYLEQACLPERDEKTGRLL